MSDCRSVLLEIPSSPWITPRKSPRIPSQALCCHLANKSCIPSKRYGLSGDLKRLDYFSGKATTANLSSEARNEQLNTYFNGALTKRGVMNYVAWSLSTPSSS